MSASSGTGEHRLRIVGKSMLTARICRFELADPDSERLPGYAAGAHITVRAPNGLSRNYSLNEAGARGPRQYVIAVARERTGSTSLVNDTIVGDLVTVSEPRNAFGLSEGSDHLLIAGGIGITPIRSMLNELRRDRPRDRVRVVYLTRLPEDAAYTRELADTAVGDSLHVHHSASDGRLDLWPYLTSPGETHVYCCGPQSLMDDVRALTMHWDPRHVHFEDFAGVAAARPGDRAFTVIWRPTGAHVDVAADQTIVQALRANGVFTNSSCNSGTCGTCTLRILAGQVEHRDVVLSEVERETLISACVSRAVTPTVELAPRFGR
jgi:phthalate 4,5-dioxygenase reductase subunit